MPLKLDRLKGGGLNLALGNSNRNAPFILWNGKKAQIKRTLFEKYVDGLEAI